MGIVKLVLTWVVYVGVTFQLLTALAIVIGPYFSKEIRDAKNLIQQVGVESVADNLWTRHKNAIVWSFAVDLAILLGIVLWCKLSMVWLALGIVGITSNTLIFMCWTGRLCSSANPQH